MIGLLLGTEEDWPTAFEEILRRLGPVEGPDGSSHAFDCERITIEPFGLRDRPRYNLVIDRLAYRYYHTMGVLKKGERMGDADLLIKPIQLRSTEQHAAELALSARLRSRA